MPPEGGIRVTFIVPARNSEDTIKECLSSIHAQRAGNGSFEVLLIDNGSSDRTVVIAKGKGATVIEGPGLTVSALRNLGARNARGEILAFVDSDCVIAQNWLQTAIPLFDDPRIGAVGAPTSVPENGTWVQRTWYLHRKKTEDREFVEWLPTENLLVRREIFKKVGGFNEKLVTCEDVDLCYRIGEFGKILSDSDIAAVHLGEARTLRHFFRKEKWRGRGSFRMMFLHGMKANEIPSMFTPIYGTMALAFFVVALFHLLTDADTGTMMVFAAFLVFLPPFIMAIRTGLRVHSLKCVFPLIILYTVYVVARTISVIPQK